jgi:hypothetical protein
MVIIHYRGDSMRRSRSFLALLLIVLIVVPTLLAQTDPLPLPPSELKFGTANPTQTQPEYHFSALRLPFEGEANVNPFPVFQWAASSDAIEFQLIVKRGNKAKLKSTFLPKDICTETLCVVDSKQISGMKALKAGKTYQWTVRLINENERRKIPRFTFTVGEALPPHDDFDRLPVETHDVYDLPQLINAINLTWDTVNSRCVKSVVINLRSSLYSMTTPYSGDIDTGHHNIGKPGLPPVRCNVTINGNGATIERSSAATDRFRVVTVIYGKLYLNRVTIRNGSANLLGGSGIFNYRGTVYVYQSTIADNKIDITSTTASAVDGAGFFNYYGQLMVNESTIQGNHNNARNDTVNHGRGGGFAIYGETGTRTVISGSILINNTANVAGGAIWNTGPGAAADGNCFMGNSSAAGKSVESINNYMAAKNSWWNHPNGPTTDTTTAGDSVNFRIVYTPFLTTAPTSCVAADPWGYALATHFPLPMNPPAGTPEARLSDWDYVDRGFSTAPFACSRDMNPIGITGGNHRIIASVKSEVWLVDTDYATPNGNLGNFFVLRIDTVDLPLQVKASLQGKVRPEVMELIEEGWGWLYIGYAHMNTVTVPTPQAPDFYPTVPAKRDVGRSGKTGLPTGSFEHLDITVYFVSGKVPSDVLGRTIGVEDPHPPAVFNPYYAYFELFRTRGGFLPQGNDSIYGLIELIDPLWLWPLLQQGTGRVDFICNGIE